MRNNPPKAKPNPINKIKVGDIFVNSWGYDQTNIDFYQVVRKSKNCIFIRPINDEKDYDNQSMTGSKMPKKNNFVGTEITKKVPYEYTNKENCLCDRIYINLEYGCGQLWNGKSCSYSTYA